MGGGGDGSSERGGQQLRTRMTMTMTTTTAATKTTALTSTTAARQMRGMRARTAGYKGSQLGIRSLLFLKKVVNFGRNFSNFDKVLIINLGLACSNNGDQDDHMASIS